MLLISSCGPAVLIDAPTSAPSASTPGPTPESSSPESTQPSISAAPRLSSQYNRSIRFEHLSLEHGLSQSVVNAILQDGQGFLWFGTEDGLNRFDGYSFKVYRPEADDSASISDRWITSLLEDRDGMMWIGTRQGGLNRFDPRSGQFTALKHDPADESSLSDDRVHTLYLDKSGNLWVGTENGLDRFDASTGAFEHYKMSNTGGLSSNSISAIYQDNRGRLWVGTRDAGLNRLEAKTDTFTVFKYDPNDSNSLSNNRVTDIVEDRNGFLWISTVNGLNRFDPFSEIFVHYQYSRSEPSSLADNTVHSLYVDTHGGLWIGTNNGLDRYYERFNRFIHYRQEPADPNSLSNNVIYSIYEDRGGVLWVGTYGSGLNKYNRQQDQFNYYRHDPDNPNSLSGNFISPIFVDEGGTVWIGTYGDGLNHFNPVLDRFTHYRHDPDNPRSLSSDEVYSILRDHNGALWVGTSEALDRLDAQTESFIHYRTSLTDLGISGLPIYVLYEDSSNTLWLGTSKGLDQFEPQTETFIHYRPIRNDPTSLSGEQVVSIVEDNRGWLWVGTFDSGLNRFNPDAEGFIRYRNDPNNPSSLSNNSVFALYEDRHGTLWIGTGGGGLDRYEPETDSFIHYTEKDGLPNNVINGIVEDDEGDLWLSTNHGLSRFDPHTNTFRNYTVSDGLQSNEFNTNAYAISPRNEIYFGGINGLNSFRPLQIKDSVYIPPITLTSLTLDGKPIEMESQVEALQEITLNWPENSFEFEFAALAYAQSSKNKYAYMLENFDSSWNEIGTTRNGRYTNLPGGSYTLLLKGSNSDGVWNETPLRLRVSVVPPFWQTMWFQGLMAFTLVTVVAGGYRLRLHGIQRRNRELEKLVHERTRALEKRSQEIEALYQADEKILRTVSLNQVFQTLVDVSISLLRADRSLILAWDEEQTHVVPRVSYGFSKKTLKLMKFAKGEGTIGRVLATGLPAIESELDPNDLRSDIRTAILEEGIKSFAHLPIKVDEKVVAVFNVGFTRPQAINDDIVRLYTALVQRASLSIANMELFEQTKELAVIEERNRLARDLHDSAKQKAFAALAQMGTVNGMLKFKSDGPDGIKPHLTEAETLIYEVIQELTFLIQEIYPIALQEKGLATTLREYIFEWETRNDIVVNLSVQNERSLPLETEQAIYRVIQESLANVSRHSRAKRVNISLVYNIDSLQASIADDGCGFDMHQRAKGMGFRSMRERIGTIRGTVQTQSAPGQGTRVLVQVPIKG
jgi:ligand-binding sensor domain-containing protein/signal transduction histidine kinase